MVKIDANLTEPLFWGSVASKNHTSQSESAFAPSLLEDSVCTSSLTFTSGASSF